APHRNTQSFVEIRECVWVDLPLVSAVEQEPLCRESGDERLRPAVRQHALDLPLKGIAFAELAAARHVYQFVVRDAAPDEERETRREVKIAQLIRGTSRNPNGIAIHPEQECRTHQQTPDRRFDARIEAALPATGIEEQHQFLYVGVGDRPSVGMTRK